MDHRNRDGSHGDVDIVVELAAMSVVLDYDVTRLGPKTWGIHGRIPYDGEVLAAVFSSESEAWGALAPLRPSPL